VRLPSFYPFVKLFKTSGHERDRLIRKNILSSYVYQFSSNLLGLLVVPLSLSYIDGEKYGIWINASIMVTWLQNMNFGMGLGMQNRVSEAMSKNDIVSARQYVSIVYKYTLIISGGLLLLGIGCSGFINWNHLFNSTIDASQLKWTTFIAFICFIFYFILNNLNSLLFSLNKASVPKLFSLYMNIGTVILLLLIIKVSHDNLILAAIALAAPAPLVLLGANIYYFKKKFPELQPQWKIVDKERINHVFGIGVKFFIMQLTTLAVHQSGTFIITHYLGPSEVTPFNLINRYFYFIYFIFSLAIAPYWSAFTEAYVKKEFSWIKKTIKRLFNLALLFTLITILMYAISYFLIPVWSRHAFDIYNYHFLLIASCVSVIFILFTAIISTFLNSINHLNLQLGIQIVMGILTIGLSIFFIKYLNYGSASVDVAIIISQVVYIIVCGWDMYKLVNRKMATDLA